MVSIEPNDEPQRIVTFALGIDADRAALSSDEELIAYAGKIVARAWLESDADPARFARAIRQRFVVGFRDED